MESGKVRGGGRRVESGMEARGCRKKKKKKEKKKKKKKKKGKKK